MTLPRLARRVPLLCIRNMPVVPTQANAEGRPVRADHVVAAWTGDIQPVRTRGESGQVIQTNEAGAVVATTIVFADVLDIAEADFIVLGTLATVEVTPGDPIGELGDPVADLLTSGALVLTEGATLDDVRHYPVDRVDRPGIGMRLDHLEVYCHLVTSPIPA